MELQKRAENDPNERDSRRAWYVIHTYSGYENKVRANLERKVASQGLGDVIFNIVVPVEDETEEKDGKTKVVQRKIFPGYVLVEMIVNNNSWYVVRNTQGVTGFVGSEKEPVPLTDEEAQRILSAMGKTTEKKPLSDLQKGDTIRITSGWLEDHTGVVTAVDHEKARIKAMVGETAVDLDFSQAEKL